MANLDQLNESRIHQALIFLAESDVREAELSGELKGQDEGLKAIKSKLYLEATGTDGVRKAVAESSEVYSQAVSEWVKVHIAWKTLVNHRNHEIRLIDLFRTLEASRRKGNI